MRSVLPCVLLLGGCNADLPCPAADLAPLRREPAFSVVLTDYASTAIAVLDADGEPITEAWIDSGTRATGIAAGLGGDAIALGAAPDGRIPILERYGRDVLTLIDRSGEVAQLDLRGDPASGHSPNPHDVVFASGAAWAVRYNPSLDPAVPELARGNDLVRIDLDAGEVTARFELGGDAVIDGAIAYARPAGIAIVRGYLVLVLARASLDFRTSAPGAIAVFDPALGTTTALHVLDRLSGCNQIEEIPGAPDHALVLCTGDAFAGEEDRRAEAGLVRIAIDARGMPSIEGSFLAADHPELATPSANLVPLDRDRALVIADPRGEDVLAGHDILLWIDVSTGEARTLHEARTSFVIGQGARARDGAFVLVPDAEGRVLRKLALDGSAIDEIPLPTCRALPPRQVAAL